jgi:uncharacterized membrane protein YeaQ/YmgE (transglycosylase-associated protein family)
MHFVVSPRGLQPGNDASGFCSAEFAFAGRCEDFFPGFFDETIWHIAELCRAEAVYWINKQTFGDGKMTLLLILLVGGIIGWLASILMRTDAQQGIFLNIVVGIVGAVIAGFVITPLIGGAPITSGAFDILSLFASFLGAVVLLAIVNLFRRGSVR